MPKPRSFTFSARLSGIDGAFISTAVFVPDSIVKKLPTGRIRTKGTMNGAPFELAIQYRKNNRRFLTVSQSLRKKAGIREGDAVTVSFVLVDPNRLELPEELEAVMEQDPEAKAAWKKLTLGHQRGLVHYVNSVKNVDSRIRRAIEILNKAKTNQLHGQKLKNEKKKKP